MGKHQAGKLGLLSKSGHLFCEAVLWPGPNPVGHALGVGGFVNQRMASLAGVGQQGRVVIVTLKSWFCQQKSGASESMKFRV